MEFVPRSTDSIYPVREKHQMLMGGKEKGPVRLLEAGLKWGLHRHPVFPPAGEDKGTQGKRTTPSKAGQGRGSPAPLVVSR